MRKSFVSIVALFSVCCAPVLGQDIDAPTDSTISVFINVGAVKNDTVRNAFIKALVQYSDEIGLHKSHKVQKGETINLIIKREYGLESAKFAGTFNNLASLIRVHNALPNNVIQPGQQLAIPDAPTASTLQSNPDILCYYSVSDLEASEIHTDSFFQSDKLIGYENASGQSAKIHTYQDLSFSSYKMLVSKLSARVRDSSSHGAFYVKVGKGDIRILVSDQTFPVNQDISAFSTVDSERIDLSKIPRKFFDSLFLIDYFYEGRKDSCGHGKKVLTVIKNIFHEYKLDDLITHVKPLPINYYQNIHFAKKFLLNFLNGPTFDNSQDFFIRNLASKLVENISQNNIQFEDPNTIPEVYLNAILLYAYSRAPSVISTSIWARTANNPAPTFVQYSSTNLVTAASDDIGSYVEKERTDSSFSGSAFPYTQPITAYYDGKQYGCLIAGCETTPGKYYGMYSKDGSGITVVGRGCNWNSDDNCLMPSDLGTSFSTPEISAKLFIAKGYWRYFDSLGGNRISPGEAVKMVELSSQLEEPFVGKFASAGRIRLKKLLQPIGAYLVDQADSIIKIDSIAQGAITYVDGVSGDTETYLFHHHSAFWGLYRMNAKYFVYDQRLRRRWFQVDPQSFSLTYYIKGKPYPIKSIQEFDFAFSQLIITKPKKL